MFFLRQLTPFKKVSTTKTALLRVVRSLTQIHFLPARTLLASLGKYFNLIIWQHTKTCYLVKSLGKVMHTTLYDVPIFRYLSFFRYYFIFCILSFISYCVSEGVLVLGDTTNRIMASKFSALGSSNTTIYSFQCFNDVELWIYCVRVCVWVHDVGNGIGKSNSVKR